MAWLMLATSLLSPVALNAQGTETAISDAPWNPVWTLQRCINHAFANNLQIREASLGVAAADLGSARAALPTSRTAGRWAPSCLP